MTVSTTIIKNFHNGNASTTNFAYQFRILENTDLLVIIRTNSTGAEATKTLSTHYTVAGAGDASGGSITFTSGNVPASGETVVIRRNVPQTQAIDYIANDPFPAETHEEGLDRATMVAQQVSEEADRSIKLSKTNTMTSTEFKVGAAERANKVLSFDSTGELSVTQELGTFKGNSATTTTAAYAIRDIVKGTTAAQLNNIYICIQASPIGTALTNTAYWVLLVDAVSAATSATAAASSATTAGNSATASANSATTSANSATTSGNSATASANSATASANSATAAANSADAFDDIYLGTKSSDPSTDNDGDALAAGMLYFNSSSNLLRVYNGSSWQNAAVDTTGFTTLTGVETLTNKTLTSPKIGTKILDTNGNELLNLTATSSAVNELTLANAASSNNPSFTASGGDTNIGVSILPKGSGQVTIDNLTFPAADGSANQILQTNGSGALSFVDNSGGTSWVSAVKTANFTAVAGEGYFVNTAGGAFEIDLPGSPSVGDEIEFVDFTRNFGTAALTLDQGSLKFQSNTSPKPSYNTNGENIKIVYSGSTQGWIPVRDDDVNFKTAQAYTVDFLCIAGGGGGGADRGAGGGAGGYRNSFASETSGGGGSSETALGLVPGNQYTVTVGGVGAGAGVSPANKGTSGADSSIAGTGITTLTSVGGGGGGSGFSAPLTSGLSGGSGGGGAGNAAPGSGTSNQGFNAEAANPTGSGAGGAGEAGGTDGNAHAGDGLASSITGSSVERGGGGGANRDGTDGGDGGQGGGGKGGQTNPGGNALSGSANTGGGGGGGGGNSPQRDGGNGGTGVVILSMADADYTGTTTGSPTVATGVSGKTVLTFNASGSYTA